MDKLKIKAQKRDVFGKKVKDLRKKGLIPAIVYGHDQKPLSLQVKYNDFEKLYKTSGGSTIISLTIDDEEPKNTLITEIQKDPVTHQYLHIDFHQVKMTEKITAEVPLVFVGESPAVKDLDGVLVKNIDQIEVSCLPADLPHEIEVDISALSDFESVIKISDLKIPSGVEVKTEPEEVVAVVTPPRSEEELKALEEEVVEEVEAVEEVGKEGRKK